VFASNVFSEVNGRFDMIISNPPFHDGLQTSLEAVARLASTAGALTSHRVRRTFGEWLASAAASTPAPLHPRAAYQRESAGRRLRRGCAGRRAGQPFAESAPSPARPLAASVARLASTAGALTSHRVRRTFGEWLTLCDVSAPAVEASRATLAANGLAGDVFASNVFSEVNGRFDMIISNPPFHDAASVARLASTAGALTSHRVRRTFGEWLASAAASTPESAPHPVRRQRPGG
jgi:methylase of polypeptide subunit release factors